MIHVQVVDSRVFSVNLHTGATIDWYVAIVVTSGGPRWIDTQTIYSGCGRFLICLLSFIVKRDIDKSSESNNLSNVVPPGWYVTRGGGRGGAGAGLLAGLEVNSLDTWDLARLGWLKVRAGN